MYRGHRAAAYRRNLSGCFTLDRIRLEILCAEGKEYVAWPGASSFETRSAADLIPTGAIVLGHYAGLASAIFLRDAASFFHRGKARMKHREVLRFGFEVPLRVSQLEVQNGDLKAPAGYSGSFVADARTNELLSLTVQAERIPEWIGIAEACTNVVYERMPVGNSRPILPIRTETLMTFADGVETRNTTVYENCRWFLADSTIFLEPRPGKAEKGAIANPAPAILPSATEIEMRLHRDLRPDEVAVGDLIRFIVTCVAGSGSAMVKPGDHAIARVIHFRQAGTLWKRVGFQPATSVGWEMLHLESSSGTVALLDVAALETHRKIRGFHPVEKRERNRLTITRPRDRSLSRHMRFRWRTR